MSYVLYCTFDGLELREHGRPEGAVHILQRPVLPAAPAPRAVQHIPVQRHALEVEQAALVPAEHVEEVLQPLEADAVGRQVEHLQARPAPAAQQVGPRVRPCGGARDPSSARNERQETFVEKRKQQAHRVALLVWSTTQVHVCMHVDESHLCLPACHTYRRMYNMYEWPTYAFNQYECDLPQCPH